MLTKEQIQFLNRVFLDTWTECNGVISVEGHVNISNMNLTQIPVQFGQVNGNFSCYSNKLTSLKGSPSIVIGNFDCDYNQLTTLEGGPKEVGRNYLCSSNQLTTLIGAPEICNDSFYCRFNQLTSLEGCPRIIKGNFKGSGNPNLYFLYNIGNVYKNVYISNLHELNEWLAKKAENNCIFKSMQEIVEYIKNGNYNDLKNSPKEIRYYFSTYELNYADILC